MPSTLSYKMMRIFYRTTAFYFFYMFGFFGGSFCAAQDTKDLFPDKDNTLIESLSGSFSNGEGPYFFAGRVGTQGDLTLRRAVVRFDLNSELPLDADIQHAELALYVSRPSDGEVQLFSLHRLVSDWGEGRSASSDGLGDLSAQNDATWIHTFYTESFWTTPGGDYESSPSAILEMGREGIYIWKDQEGILEDIRYWLNHPEENFGWILLGNEDGTGNTVKRIGSRENTSPEQRPKLSVTYLDPALPVELMSFEGLVEGDQVHLAWSTSSETNNAGFEVQKEGHPLAFIPGAGTTTQPQQYKHTVSGLAVGTHQFRLKQIDFDGTFAYSPVVEIHIDSDNLAVLHVYPSPFNPSTQVLFYSQREERVQIQVFNAIGEQVQILHEGYLSAGRQHRFTFEPGQLPSGLYWVLAKGRSLSLARSMVYVK